MADIEEMYLGMLEIGSEYGMAIVGGDIVGSPVLFVTTALTGVTRSTPMLRSNALPGDVVAVSGYVGNSGGGLRVMLEQPSATGDGADFLREAHRRPIPAVRCGQMLSSKGIVTAMDISDGLADDLGKLCAASGVAARIQASSVPVHRQLRQQFPDECLDLALGGGEDYVLLFTGPAEVVEPLIPQLGDGGAIIGTIEEAGDSADAGRVYLVNDGGTETQLTGSGWDHLRYSPEC